MEMNHASRTAGTAVPRVGSDRAMVLAAAVLYCGLYLYSYPTTFAIWDESSYLSTAYVYRQATIYGDVAGVSCLSSVQSGSHLVCKHGPLNALVLMPFTFFGWRATFIPVLLLHLCGYFAFAWLVRRERLPVWTSLLYLFHPTLLYYSRTLMSDTLAGVLRPRDHFVNVVRWQSVNVIFLATRMALISPFRKNQTPRTKISSYNSAALH